MLVPLLDAGHGGIVDGVYVTAPSKMHRFPDGTKIEEGVVNRQIRRKLIYMLTQANIPFEVVNPENEDISLTERKKRIAAFHKKHKGETLTISQHLNAGGGEGYEVYTSEGTTVSDVYATEFINAYKEFLPLMSKRVDITDGDEDKEKNFSILLCKGAAVLLETGFMDNYENALFLLSDRGQSIIAKANFEAIKRCIALHEKKKKQPKPKAKTTKKK